MKITRRIMDFTCCDVRVFSVAVLLTASMLPIMEPTLAQEIVVEEVVVTGSRIAREANLTGALPVQAMNADDIAASGEFSLADSLNDIPALLSSITAEQSIDRAGRHGSNRLNLRGLGQNRTLVLVDGRRHVGGLKGSSAVDIGSIPQSLVERVEVLTGGASAIYGADAVTGVVNFILRDDFDGLEVQLQQGISEYADAGQTALSVAMGENFNNGRSNIAFSLELRQDQGLKVHERSDGFAIGSASDWVNPALRFQKGDIRPATPNFSRYFNYANTGLFRYGLKIPSQEDFIADYTAEFGEAPNLTAAETVLFERAANAPQRVILPYSNFTITSGYGYIIPGNPFTNSGFDPETPIDLDGNGTPDCLDSFTGYNSSFSAAGYGIVGGCWRIGADGSYRPIRDDLIASNFNGFGGDSFNAIRQRDHDILLPDEKIALNLLGRHLLTDSLTLFGEVKHVIQETEAESRPSSFWDLLFGAPDNPFLPEFIRDVANDTGGVAITIDPLLFDAATDTRRDTSRIATGLEGELNNGWTYELSVSYGRYEEEVISTGQVIIDRFFAAIDAVTDPSTRQPACRADVNPASPPTNTPFKIPRWSEGFFSFTPGAGQCVPLNIWRGLPGVTPEAAHWVTTTTLDELTIDQGVFAAHLTGNSEDWFTLPGGALVYAIGTEYRKESSYARFDTWQRGVIPTGSPFSTGTLISEVSDNGSLVFDPSIIVRNEQGEYDTTDFFVEFSLPLLVSQPTFEELTLDVAGRWANYSTIGSAESWKVNLVWAPLSDFALRASLSRAVRAPNITELFGPTTGTTARPADPCDVAQINAIATDNPSLAQNTQANCVADFQSFGLDPFDAQGNYAFTDPLSARFSGVASGNPDLSEETADTFTFGLVLQPSFLPELDLTLDYWEISIEDAIASVTPQDIVNSCYQGESLNHNFCQLFTRNTTVSSAQFGGFNFIRLLDINFARLETDGIDASVGYEFSRGTHDFTVSVTATKVNTLNNFTNPTNLNDIDVELGEILRPELAGNVMLRWTSGNLSVGWYAQYLGEMLLGGSRVEIDTAHVLFGDAVFMGGVWTHDLNVQYATNGNLTVYGGINNMTHTDPFITENAFPASPRGRMIFIGGKYSL